MPGVGRGLREAKTRGDGGRRAPADGSVGASDEGVEQRSEHVVDALDDFGGSFDSALRLERPDKRIDVLDGLATSRGDPATSAAAWLSRLIPL